MPRTPPQPSRRAGAVRPFLVMEVLERAQALERAGRDVIHLEVGEPDFPAPAPVIAAARDALEAGRTRYTPSLGDPRLREAIAGCHHAEGAVADPETIAVSSGTSPVLLLALMAVLEPGDEVLVPDPGYACYPNLVELAGGRVRRIPLNAEDGFVVDAEKIAAARTPRTRAALLNSPANPTGAVIDSARLEGIVETGLWVIVDEVYRGLEYGARTLSAAALDAPNVIVVDGVSKRYAMTGFRLGWGLFPPALVPSVRAMQQNVLISAPEPAQHAAVTALTDPDVAAEVARRVEILDRRRRLLLAGLEGLGLRVPAPPAGAFYALARAEHLGSDVVETAAEILDATGVALTPGADFGPGGEAYLRFSFANSEERIAEALDRLTPWLAEKVGG